MDRQLSGDGIPAFPAELEARITAYLVGPVPPPLLAAIKRTPPPAEWKWLFSNGRVQQCPGSTHGRTPARDGPSSSP